METRARADRSWLQRATTALGTSLVAGLTLAQACTSEKISAVDIGSITLSPASSTVMVGLTVGFEATVYDGEGAVLRGAPVSWSTDRDDIASVDGEGVATGLAPGTTTVRASFSGISAGAALTVEPRPAIAITPGFVALYAGASGPSPEPVVLRLTNQGGGDVADLVVSIAHPEGSASGWLNAEVATSTVPTDLTLTAVSQLLSVGRYDATVTVTSSDMGPDDVPATATVTLSVSAFTVTESGGSTQVVEYGQSDSLAIVLDAEPASDVILLVISDDTNEVRVSPTRLTFTPAQWNVPRTITVVPVGDSEVDGNQTTTVTVSVDGPRSDVAYRPAVARIISVTAVDGDAEGLAIAESQGGTIVTEAGSIDAITVVLTARPSGDVVVDVVSSDTGEVAVAPLTLTFTPTDWSSRQPVALTGVDDPFIDGDVVTMVTVSVDSDRSTAEYRGVAAAIFEVTTLDDDDAGMVIVEGEGDTSVSESGTEDSFTVSLTARPTSSVVLDVLSGDPSEVALSPTRLTFTPATWNQPRTVTVTGVDDDLTDGTQTAVVSIVVDAGASDDAFDDIEPGVVRVTVADDDAPGFTITSGTTVSVDEAGGNAQVTLVLNTEPSSNVTLTLVSLRPSLVMLSAGRVTFDPSTWDEPRSVTLTAVDDEVVGGDRTTTVVVGVDSPVSDDDFDGVADQTIVVTVEDDDVAGFTLADTAGLVVGERSGTDTFTAVLDSRPIADVVLTVVSGDVGEVTAAPTSLVFTPTTWADAQTVTLAGVDDALLDGDQETTVTVSVSPPLSDDAFDDMAPRSVRVTTKDDEEAEVVLADTLDLTVTESGTSEVFRVSLGTAPASNVVLRVASGDVGEVTAAPATLTFTPTSWADMQTVTLSGVDDSLLDGDQESAVTVAVDKALSDDAFDGVPTRSVRVTTTDDDGAGFTLAGVTGLRVDESGGEATFTAVLDAQPISDVMLTVTSADVGEATATPASLTFTSTNWGDPQTVTLAGVDDALLDGDRETIVTVAVDAAVSDDAFDGVLPRGVTVTTTDDDIAGFTLADTTNLTVGEGGGTALFTVTLDAQPASDVVLDVTSADVGEATATPVSLTFTSTNWGDPQTVTLAGVDDALLDGDRETIVTVAVDAAVSDDAFDGVIPQGVTVTTTDDDTSGITLSPDRLTVSEAGGVATFTVRLDSQPISNVVLDVSSLDQTEVSVAPRTLTFTASDWNVLQEVTISGVDDDIIDGDRETRVLVIVNAARSDPAYSSVPAQEVVVTTTDDDAFTTGDEGSTPNRSRPPMER